MRLKFDSQLYSREAVDAAIESFAGLAKFEVSEQDGIIGVKVTGEDLDADFADEFSNHVLGGMA